MKNTGFSLVELIVVIAIMAVLAGVAVPVYSHFVEDSKKGKDNDYVAEVYRLACLEAASEGLEVEKVVVALEGVNSEDVDFTGRLALVYFKGETDENAATFDDVEARIVAAVWEKTKAHTFSYSKWTDLQNDEDPYTWGVSYTYENDEEEMLPYKIEGVTSDPNAPVELPDIPL